MRVEGGKVIRMKLTVIIPVYNGRGTIRGCLESLEKQTFREFGVLAVDDGSTDGTEEVIRAFAQEHPEMRIEVIRQENQGAAMARNEGIRRTETPYLTLMDQDDYIEPDYLETYMAAMEESGADIVCGGYKRVHPETGRVLRTVRPGKDDWAKYVVVAPWAHLYRTEFLQEHGIRFLKTRIGEDIYFTLTAYAHTEKIVTIPYDGYCWADNPDSVSNSKQKQMQREVDPLVLLNALWDGLPEKHCLRQESLEYFLYRYIVWYLLFTVRHTPKETVEEQYHRLMNWLGERCPGFAKNKMISLTGPAGEPFGIRLSVWGFTVLYRCGLALPALKLFAGGKKGERPGK